MVFITSDSPSSDGAVSKVGISHEYVVAIFYSPYGLVPQHEGHAALSSVIVVALLPAVGVSRKACLSATIEAVSALVSRAFM